MVSNRAKFTVLAPVLEAVNRVIPGQPHRLLSDRVGELEPSAVLEVCAGGGYLARLIAGRRPGCRVTALDISAESLELGRRLASRSGLANVEFVEADAARMPFDDAKFDCVVSCFGLHEIPTPVRPAALREISRVLRRGGCLLIVDLERPTTWWRPAWDIAVRVGEKPDAWDVLGDGLVAALADAGFAEVVKVGFSNRTPFQTIEAISAT